MALASHNSYLGNGEKSQGGFGLKWEGEKASFEAGQERRGSKGLCVREQPLYANEEGEAVKLQSVY